MAFDLTDCQFQGPALPEPFVKFELEKELTRRKLLAKTTGAEGKALQDRWTVYRRKLRDLAASGGSLRVRNHVVEPLVELLGFSRMKDAEPVQTREDQESGGTLLLSEDGEARLRILTTSFNEDLYAPAKRGRAYRFSHLRVAQRVLLAKGERAGLLTNGVHLMLMVSDPARPDSTVTIPLDPGWKRSRDIPDSFRFLLAIASPQGLEALPDIVDKARLHQTRVTKELRVQARQAVERFVQEVLDHPDNRGWFEEQNDRQALARDLWREGLIIIYRLLFTLKGESSDDPARTFNFASTSLWRTTYSPSMALAPYARDVIERGVETGKLLEDGLRTLFRLFEEGLECTELVVKPLGGALFGVDATPTLARLAWGERAVAWLLDRLLWTPKKRGVDARERVHYGSLWVEDLGRVYEALLELDPGISTEPMCRLRRQKLEVVVPLEQGEPYRPADVQIDTEGEDLDTDSDDENESEDEDEAPRRGKKTKVEWIEAIPPGRFYLRVGLGRKASGSYYTPHSFVRFLVQETLGPQVAERSPSDDPKPGEILKLKVLDPAMGSGHFLVEACRFLGAHLYEAARLCDEKALDAERRAERAKNKKERETAEAEAREYRQRVIDLPDPDDEIVRYLPSRSPEGEESGVSQRKAEALCRRMVAVHCLYGVDKNPLAVELAKLALWLESHAEGMPLTFLDHRLVVGDSLTGPFWEHLVTRPSNPEEPVDGVFHQGLAAALQKKLSKAISSVKHLEATVGVSLSEMNEKKRLKVELDQALRPFRIIAAAWSGGVMLGPEKCDDSAYADLLRSVAEIGEIPEIFPAPSGSGANSLTATILKGLGNEHPSPVSGAVARREALYDLLDSNRCVPALPYDIAFPEVFYPSGALDARQGFHAVLGNPPWDRMLPADKEFFASYNFRILDAPTKRERSKIQDSLLENPKVKEAYDGYIGQFRSAERAVNTLYNYQVVLVEGEKTIGKQDVFRLFMERNAQLLDCSGTSGVVVPSAFHANEGATGIRMLYLDKMALRCCYSFENRRKLFEIHRSFKFALVVAAAHGPSTEISCAFYLHDDEWLFGERDGRKPLRYSRDFVRRTGGDYLSILELRSTKELDVAEVCFANGTPFGHVCDAEGLRFGREINMTDDAWRFVSTTDVLGMGKDPRVPPVLTALVEQGYLVLREGKNFWHFDDVWEAPPSYLVAVQTIQDKSNWLRAASYFRPAYRAIASSTNERTIVFHILPYGAVFGNSAPVQREPWLAANHLSIAVVAAANTFSFDWTARVRAGANINQFILFSCPLPNLSKVRVFLRSQGLRLSANHIGYKPLWLEQVGDVWREDGKQPFAWPALVTDDERWHVRSAIDAVVADAYGLSRDQYEHVLSTFSHASYPKAPELCLAKFDELKRVGLDAFTRKYDPYHDIPLNQNLPRPVIDLPLPETPVNAQTEVEL